MLQKLITLAICQHRLIARQTNVAKGETLSMMDSSVPNEVPLLCTEKKTVVCIKGRYESSPPVPDSRISDFATS